MDYEFYYERALEYVTYEQEPIFRKEIIQLMNEENLEELHDRFYTELAFGTAGMRGIIGGGYNRMNSYMVRRVTQGLSAYMKDQVSGQRSVVIAYDSRNYSDVFASAAADVLCANDIRVYRYDTIHPVPLLSFAVRYMKASAGIVITASHNPAQYNGYKIYWSDGGQAVAPHDTGIAAEVGKVTSGEMIASVSLDAARASGLLSSVPDEVDQAYDTMVIDSIRDRGLFARGIPCKVVYTPLHGSGNIPIQRLFRILGVDYQVVEEQEAPDGNFPTVDLPNPENPKAMSMAIDVAKKVHADIVLGTDPDSDRLGIGIPTDKQKKSYTLLNGNQIAVLLCDYLLSQQESPIVNGVCVKSIVTTDLMKQVAEYYGCECRDVLTGFKYIADQMHRIVHERKKFIFGAEESFGYLSVTEVYDKDAVSTAILAVEMMLYYKEQGKSLLARLEELWLQFGYYDEKVIAKTYPGSEGRAKIDDIMRTFREVPPKEIGGMKVMKTLDLIAGTDSLPAADVVIITLEGGSKVIVRPSGTEPKIKYYLFSVASHDELIHAKTESLGKRQAMIASLGL